VDSSKGHPRFDRTQSRVARGPGIVAVHLPGGRFPPVFDGVADKCFGSVRLVGVGSLPLVLLQPVIHDQRKKRALGYEDPRSGGRVRRPLASWRRNRSGGRRHRHPGESALGGTPGIHGLYKPPARIADYDFRTGGGCFFAKP